MAAALGGGALELCSQPRVGRCLAACHERRRAVDTGSIGADDDARREAAPGREQRAHTDRPRQTSFTVRRGQLKIAPQAAAPPLASRGFRCAGGE